MRWILWIVAGIAVVGAHGRRSSATACRRHTRASRTARVAAAARGALRAADRRGPLSSRGGPDVKSLQRLPDRDGQARVDRGRRAG